MRIDSVDQFAELVAQIEAREGYRRPAAFAVGLASLAISELEQPERAREGAAVLDTWYPAPNYEENFAAAALLAELCGHRAGAASYRLNLTQLERALEAFAPFDHERARHPNLLALRQLRDALRRGEQMAERYRRGECGLAQALPRVAVVSFIADLQDKPSDVHDAYLRLHLLSARKVRPHGQNLEGLFGILPNVVWTNVGPFAPEGFERVRGLFKSQGFELRVHAVDKFPRMTDYVLPAGVRIADGDRVRLGAYLGEGTTVMHEGFVNFNAGTLGKSMVEGRISAGVTVDDGSDIGGGASIMGTLSGGGNVVNRLGKNCLLGANSGCGIPLGDGCTIEAGLYITAGSKVRLWDGQVVKARELAGHNDLLFRRNSLTGAIEVVRKKNEVVLNPELHKN